MSGTANTFAGPIPAIREVNPMRLVGIRGTMSLANNLTGVLWKAFMPRRHEIKDRLSPDLISLQIYGPSHFRHFDPAKEFEKWAAVQVSAQGSPPAGMEEITIPGGLYAVFHYNGPGGDPAIFRYILGNWLPASDFMLDDRPHFEVLGAGYRNNDPDSEEDIFIPVKAKGPAAD